MVRITPFKGITYNFNKLKPVKELFAPPYDVISPQYQDELYKRNQYNIIKLILGKIYDSDDGSNNRYTRAAADYNNWVKENVLVQSEMPKIYYYVQKYSDTKGNSITRKGFIARCYLEDFTSGKVLPHEETMGGPKKDRLNLMEATKANFSQIFSVYSDPEKRINQILENACHDEALIDVIDDDNVRHIFYEVSDNEAITKVKSLMEDKIVIIADGHHRYETALKYRDNKKAEGNTDTSEDIPHNSVMMYFANFDDEGLKIYPTHRLLKKSPKDSLDGLLEKLKLYFNVTRHKFELFEECFAIMERENKDDTPIGLVSKKDPTTLYVLTPYFKRVTDQLVIQNVPEILTKLDVTILHRLILENLMGLDTVELKNQNNIEFIRNETELIEKFTCNEAEIIFLLTVPNMVNVKEICMSGLRMPQKTTYFYPKLLSGLVINPLE